MAREHREEGGARSRLGEPQQRTARSGGSELTGGGNTAAVQSGLGGSELDDIEGRQNHRRCAEQMRLEGAGITGPDQGAHRRRAQFAEGGLPLDHGGGGLDGEQLARGRVPEGGVGRRDLWTRGW